MVAFRRRFLQDPGDAVLLEIESINIIDRRPPGNFVGVGTGTACLVGEFEDGEFERPTEVFSDEDLEAKFGGFGFQRTAGPYRDPVARQTGGAELWNGNGFMALKKRKFSRLIIARVDNRAGEVTFSRLACLFGDAGTYDLEPNETVTADVDGSSAGTATFLAETALIEGDTFSAPAAGDRLELSVDGAPTRAIVWDGGETITQVVDLINQTVGAPASTPVAEDDGGGDLDLRSIIRGQDGRIQIVGGINLSTIGLSATPTGGVETGTVNSVSAGTYTIRVTVRIDGVDTDYDADVVAAGAEPTTDIRDDIVSALQALSIPGVTIAAGGGSTWTATGDDNVQFSMTVEAEPTPGDVTIATTTPAVLTDARGTGNVRNIDRVTTSEAATVLSDLSGVTADVTEDGLLRACATTTPSTGTLQFTGGTALTALGFNTTDIADASDMPDTEIPAGTVVVDSVGGQRWLTLQTLDTEEEALDGNTGPFTIPVRPANDNDTTLNSSSGNVTQIETSLEYGWSVTNSAAIVRMNAAQLDAAYENAINSTIDANGVSRDINIIVSARTSDNIRRAIRTNAINASALGHRGRVGIGGPGLDTSVDSILGASVPGVSNYRDQRFIYVGAGFRMFVPEIATVGASNGGTGFSDDGIVETRGDVWYASIRSILPPEENAGQDLSTTNYGALPVLGLNASFDSSLGGTGLTLSSYRQLKSNGVVMPNFSREEGAFFQSDVTSVDGTTDAELAPALRRFMADFIQDSIQALSRKHSKKLTRDTRIRANLAEVRGFLIGLESPQNPEVARIRGWSLEFVGTQAQVDKGLVRNQLNVKLFEALISLTFTATIGATVEIEEAA